MEYFYYAIEIKNREGKSHASAQRVHHSNNLYGYFDRFCDKRQGDEIISITPFSTLKQARETVDAWNEAARMKGTWMFS